eukprot:1189246-Prorocentrum_minimum.AAC.1
MRGNILGARANRARREGIYSERGPTARGERGYTRSTGQSCEERGDILRARANRHTPEARRIATDESASRGETTLQDATCTNPRPNVHRRKPKEQATTAHQPH